MNITTKNYFSTVKKFDVKSLPEILFLSHDFIAKETKNGKDWSAFGKDAGFTRMAKLVFIKLEEFMNSDKKIKSKKSLDGVQSKIEYKAEVYLIKKFLALDNNLWTSKEINELIEELQEAIVKRKITKRSPFAKEINNIQTSLLKLYNGTKSNRIKIALMPETKTRLLKTLSLASKYQKSIFPEPLPEKIDKISLRGIEEEVVEAPKEEENKIMSSVDFSNLQFDTIGFEGKWLNLIGDPSPGFTAMVFGMPKMGKSYLCIDFANYLSLNHGKVLYVSKEEYMSPTLAIKLKDKNVANENLDITGSIPGDISPYDFIFLDSVTSLKLSPDDLKELKEKNPNASFVYVFQATKDGKARGANEHTHNVDIVIEVPEKGKAVQYGRFNQGGEMNIFGEEQPLQEQIELNGVGKNKKNLPVPKKVSNVATMKKKTTKVPDWTEPKGLNPSDWESLKAIKKYCDAGKFKEAMEYATQSCDTVIREEIPGDVWVKMGGKLTASGMEKLKGSPPNYNERRDDDKPKFIFSMTSTLLLVEALKGDFNLNYLVRKELANRGLNAEGIWVGFNEAAKIHKIK